MNSFWKNIIIRRVIRRHGKSKAASKGLSGFMLAKGAREFKFSAIRLLKDSLMIFLGIIAACFGLKSFLLPNHFIDGGATGISLLITQLTPLSLPLTLIIINAPFVILGYKLIGKSFFLKTAVGICGLAICSALIPFPVITNDKLLVAVFGGFFLGAGIGLSVRGGAVIDGTEVLAIFLSRRLGMTIGDVVLIFNILIFSVAAYFLTIETALYSVLTYLAASRTVDFIIEGIEEYTGITIISVKSEEIRKMIIYELGRGVTVYKGKRGFGRHGETNDIDIIYTVITRLEINNLNTEVEKIDPGAFIVMNSIKDTKGGMIKKRPMKE